MAEGTLGRKLLDGDRQVYIHKIPIEVRAEIVVVSSLSGHADYYEILHWLEPIKTRAKDYFYHTRRTGSVTRDVGASG